MFNVSDPDRKVWCSRLTRAAAILWLINLGLLVFFDLCIATDTRLGAIVMGVGVLLGVVTMIWRLLTSGSEAMAETEMPAA